MLDVPISEFNLKNPRICKEMCWIHWVKIKNACLWKGKGMTTFKLMAEIYDHRHLPICVTRMLIYWVLAAGKLGKLTLVFS